MKSVFQIIASMIRWGLLFCATLSLADTIELHDGSRHEGRLLKLADGQLSFRISNTQSEVELPVQDLTMLSLGESSSDAEMTRPNMCLIAAGDSNRQRPVKLRKGFHRLTVVYAGTAPRLTLQRSDSQPIEIPAEKLFRPEQRKEFKASPGIDANGYRLPDSPGNVQFGATFRHYRSDIPIDLKHLDRPLHFVESGRTDSLKSSWAESPRDMGIFTMLVEIDTDGTYDYVFDLVGNPRAALYLGNLPSHIAAVLSTSTQQPDSNRWRVILATGGYVEGELVAWSPSGIKIETTIDAVPTLDIPFNHVLTLMHQTGSTPTDLDVTPDDGMDVVIASVAEGRIARVFGRVLGISDGKLQVEYQGRPRPIRIDKVIAIYLAGTKADPPTFCYQQWQPNDECQLDLVLKSVDDREVLAETLWGQPLRFRRDNRSPIVLSIRNGRVQFLSDLAPIQVEEIPYFDRMMHWKRDQSLTGGPLTIGEVRYDKGLATHSFTQLTYRLDQQYSRFMATVGLAPETADLGDVIIRVLGDNMVLFEHVLRGDTSVEIDVSIEGVRQLDLVTDFGNGQDVGDRVHWANARLIRIAK